jgi:hypothetical protein
LPGACTAHQRTGSRAFDRCEAVQLARPAKALQLMEPGVLEGQPGALEEIHDRRGDENVARSGDGHDPGRGMDRDPPDIASDRLDLSRVDSGADLEAQAVGRVADGGRAPNCALGPVKLGEHSVAGGLDELSAMAINGRRCLSVVLSNEVAARARGQAPPRGGSNPRCP